MASCSPEADIRANTIDNDVFSECERLTRTFDEDRWLSARYAPPALRKRLYSLYAFHAEIALVPDRVSEPPLGEIRLQWWREAVSDQSGAGPLLPVIEGLRKTGISEGDRSAIDAAINARARLFYSPDFESADDLAEWLRRSEAWVAVAAARAAAPSLSKEALQAVEDAAIAFGLARARARHPELKLGPVASALRLKTTGQLSALPLQAAPAVAHFALTGHYLKGSPVSPVRKRLALFLGVATGRF